MRLWDLSVAQAPTVAQLQSYANHRRSLGRGAQAEVFAYRFPQCGGELVLKPCRRQIAQQVCGTECQEWEIGQRLACIRKHIPIAVPLIAWWPPASPVFMEGLCMPRCMGSSLWGLYASPVFNAQTVMHRDKVAACHDTESWTSLLLCVLWGLHMLQRELLFQHNDLAAANVLAMELPAAKRGDTVWLDFGSGLQFRVKLPYHPQIGCFFPQLIDPSHSSVRNETTGFPMGFTALKCDGLEDEQFKHAVGYEASFNGMYDVAVLFRELLDVQCTAWSTAGQEPDPSLMKLLIDGASLEAYALGLSAPTFRKCKSPSDILAQLASKFKLKVQWQPFHTRDMNPDQHRYMSGILESLEPQSYYTRMPKTHFQPMWSQSVLELVHNHAVGSRVFAKYAVTERDHGSFLQLPNPPTTDMQQALREFNSLEGFGARLEYAAFPGLEYGV